MPGFIVRQTIVINTTQYVEATDAKDAIRRAERLSEPLAGPRITIEVDYGSMQVGEVPERR